jgi:hypothetical protein
VSRLYDNDEGVHLFIVHSIDCEYSCSFLIRKVYVYVICRCVYVAISILQGRVDQRPNGDSGRQTKTALSVK